MSEKLNIEKFNINERFDFVEDLTRMVAEGNANSIIISGEGGLGKSYIVMETVKRIGCGYKKVGGYSTARGLYNMLYDYNGELFIFDDCDSILEDKTAKNILKVALDSNNPRIITWSAKMTKKDLQEYPQDFNFTGRIIFITNKPQEKIFQPLLTRAFKVDLTMTASEKIERMEKILPGLCKKNNLSSESGLKALKFLNEKRDKVKTLSLRTLLDIIRIINSNSNWERLAEYTILQ